jgi:hypothetical protein
MDAAEARRLRREILDDVGALLDEQLAGGEWGRLLVEVVRGPDGEPIVAAIDVEEIVGDEARVDAAFGGESVRALLPMLAKSSEALCGLEGVDLEDVRGGTFIRRREGGYAWLPGRVRTPSGPFDAHRDEVVSRAREKNERLGIEFGSPVRGHLDADLVRGEAVIETRDGSRLRAHATLLGTFAPATRTWGWGSSNPHLPELVRRASAAVVDGILDRSMWELSTPVFETDESTAWAIASLVCERAGGDAICCGPDPGGSVFLLLTDPRREGA